MQKQESKLTFVGQHIISIIISAVMGIVLLSAAKAYNVSFPNLANFIAYFCTIIGLPLSFLMLIWKRKPLRWYMMIQLVIIIILSSTWYYQRISVRNTDPSTYLTGDSSFEKAARLVMPNINDGVDIAEFCHSKSNTGFEYLELTLVYPPDQYQSNINLHKQNFQDFLINYSDAFYFKEDVEGLILDHHVCQCYTFNVDGIDYAVAYTYCAETKEIRFLFFSAWELCSLSMKDTLIINRYKTNSIG